MFDIHVHSTFSHDGKSTLDEYCRLFDAGDITGIGFAEHVDFLPEAYGYGLFDHSSYISAVKKCRQNGYGVYAGAEIDYAKRVEKDIISSLKTNKYDYTICSVHMINGFSVSTNENIHLYEDKAVFKDVIEKYYYEVMEALDVSEFDVVGHLGIYKRYLGRDFIDKSSQSGYIAEMEAALAKKCAQSGKIVEINTSGLFSPFHDTFPDKNFLKVYYRYGGSNISIGSDAHIAAHAARGYSESLELLRDIGFKYLTLPWNKEGTVII